MSRHARRHLTRRTVLRGTTVGGLYWAKADTATGRFISPYMLPGTYTLTVYKDELAVHSTSVTVTAGKTTALHTLKITADPSLHPAI